MSKKQAIKKKQESSPTKFITSGSFNGPIPPPQILNSYEQVVPGLGERITIMAEEKAKHLAHMEKASIEYKYKEISAGQRFAFIIAILGIFAAVGCSAFGDGLTARILLGTTLAALVSSFLLSPTYKSKKD